MKTTGKFTLLDIVTLITLIVAPFLLGYFGDWAFFAFILAFIGIFYGYFAEVKMPSGNRLAFWEVLMFSSMAGIAAAVGWLVLGLGLAMNDGDEIFEPVFAFFPALVGIFIVWRKSKLG